MKIYNVIQGSEEWLKIRLGLPTASEFDKLITPTGKESTQWEAYANKLLAEMLAGCPVESFEGNAWTERGNMLEADAVSFYELTTDNETTPVGFVTNDAKTIGCSPDRLIGNDGLLEIKCPAPHTHISYLLEGKIDKKYYPQVQGQLYVTGRLWSDLVSYHPSMPPVIIRIKRDDEFLQMLDSLLKRFLNELSKRKKSLLDKGYQCKI